jgi:hypothetical protein
VQDIEIFNNMTESIRPIWNVYAIIPGRVDDELVILGNHRDAWGFGAADPISGSAVVAEIVTGLGELLREGWQPERTLVIASWDAEEVRCNKARASPLTALVVRPDRQHRVRGRFRDLPQAQYSNVSERRRCRGWALLGRWGISIAGSLLDTGLLARAGARRAGERAWRTEFPLPLIHL